MKFYEHNIQANFSNWWLKDFLKKFPSGDCHCTSLMLSNIGSGTGDCLDQDQDKPLPDPMLMQIYVAICHH